MLVQKVEVIRHPPSDRSIYKGLAGRLTVSIVTTSHLHIGSGAQFIIKTSQPPERIHFKEDYIPFTCIGGQIAILGSSVKGNVRARLELSFKNKDGKVRSCFLKASPPILEPPVGQHGWRHYRIWKQVLKEDRGTPCDHTVGAPVCLVCNIFGTTGLRSLVEFSDFFGDEVGEEPLVLEHGVKLVAVPPNTRFRGTVFFHNLKPEELGLVFLGMGLEESRVGRPVLLGRLKYRRQVSGRTFGRVRYEVEEIGLAKCSQSLRIGEAVLMEPDLYEKDKLDDIIVALVHHTLSSYDGELQIIREVDAVEKL